MPQNPMVDRPVPYWNGKLMLFIHQDGCKLCLNLLFLIKPICSSSPGPTAILGATTRRRREKGALDVCQDDQKSWHWKRGNGRSAVAVFFFVQLGWTNKHGDWKGFNNLKLMEYLYLYLYVYVCVYVCIIKMLNNIYLYIYIYILLI